MIRLNRRDVSRIEGFSDAVFGFALTLLVASIEVPPDFEALKLTLRGFLPFALTFTLISWIWYLHYSFFRTYGLEDRLTVVLNSILLFVVLFFVYPLKVMANNLVPLFTGIGESGFANLSEYDNRFLMVAYSSGVIAVFLVFFLLHWNAYRQRATLELPPEIVFDTLTGMRAHALSVSLGLTSVMLALTAPMDWRFSMAGMIYALEGPFQGLNGYFSGTRRAKMFPSSTPAPL
ncbi:MAG: TMEM175 family protein [Acidobacteriota bacterium]|nr:TMEM175 family protein [Acidobacteriota bacterium]